MRACMCEFPLLIVKLNSEVCISSHGWMAEWSKASYMLYELDELHELE